MKAVAIFFLGIALLTGGMRAQDVNVLVSNVAGAATNNPVVGPGYIVRPAPHVDLNIIWNAATQTFTGGFRTTDETPAVQFAGDKAVAYLPPTGRRTSTATYPFQGPSGSTYWIFPSSAPSSNGAQTLYLGLSAYGVPNNGTFAPLAPSTTGRIVWTVHSVENLTTPSANAFYGYSVSGGAANIQLTRDPDYPNRELPMLANSHTHLNLLFRAAGMYRITFRIRGTLVSTGQEVSSLVPVYFGVEQWQIPTAAAPAIALAGNLAFGNVTVGQISTRTLTISNSGNAPLNVSSINYPAGFSGNWSSGSIAAGASQNVTVSFAPNAATNFSGNLTVNSDATSGTNAIAASGTGTPAPTRIVALSGNLAFGNVTVGQISARTLTISNSGNAPLNVSSISYPAGFSGNWNSGNIAAGASQNVTVTFAPNAATNFSGNLTVNSDATSGTNTIAASGTGTAATVSYTAWRGIAFSPLQAVDPLISGPGADPDGDGFANLAEFAFGGDPLVPDASLIAPRLERSGNSWLFTVRQRTDASGLTITPVATASLHPGLADWRADLLTPHGQPRKVAAGIDEFAYLLDGGLTDRAFLRVRTQLTAP